MWVVTRDPLRPDGGEPDADIDRTDDGLIDVDAEFDLDVDVDLPGDELPPLEPDAELLALLSRKYAIQMVYLVGATGGVRFSDLTGALPDASTSTLSARVDELAAAGLLDREEYDEVPPRVEYAPTDAGREVAGRLAPLVALAGERA